MNNLTQYLQDNKISHKIISDTVVSINSIEYNLVKENEDDLLFDDYFQLIVDDKRLKNFVFNFGGRWYYSESHEKVQLNPLKYIGKSVSDIPTDSFLGVRACYELLNGSRLYKDWCKKAQFLGIKTLGICEKNTLAGVLKFQLECKKWGIKPIIGATYTIFDEKNDYRFDIKCYVQNEMGWRNLLLINKEVNVTNTRFITKDVFLTLREGLFLIADPKSIEYTKLDFNVDFYQLDTVEFEDNNRESWYLENLKKFFESKIQPVSITDAFYLDKEDNHIKEKLNTIGGFHEYQSKNQYFKDKEDYFTELSELFEDTDERLYDVFTKAVTNEEYICSSCDFSIEVGKKRIPKYKMTSEEKEKFGDTETLFWSLIEEGFSKKCPKGKEDEYLTRLDYEVSIIKMVKGINGSNGIDYFLILWDVIRFCNEKGILVGHGRGSSGGVTVAWYLDIVKTDPIKFNLLFERFLNPARAVGETPDIDIDVDPTRKEEVKLYLREKYGVEHFCYIGTYTTFQLKQAMTDLVKLDGGDIASVKIASKSLKFDDLKGTYKELFTNAQNDGFVKHFLKKYSNGISDIPFIYGQPRAKSIHACATIILPEEDNIFTTIPVRLVTLDSGETILVSEWEGKELEIFGALKEDILVIEQLTKYRTIIDLLKENLNIDIDIYNIPLDDKKVYDFFKRGLTSDIFQFGTSTFKKYLQELKPDNINELVHAVALCRPGAMNVNTHNEYVLRKHVKRAVTYKYGTEDVTADTLGLLVMQEQIILLCQSLGGFTLAEGDLIRKGIGKKQQSIIDEYKPKFIQGAVKNGCPESEALEIWHEIEVHGSYSFNASHSVNYTHVSHVGMYFKIKYPLAFWTAAFKHDSSGANAPEYISEIHKTGDIIVMPPSINISDTNTKTDFTKNTIYWALSSIKQVGETSTNQIMQDRESNGQYFSFEEFLDRNLFKDSKVNKRTVENLVLCGVFDELDNIKQPKNRIQLIEFYRDKYKVKVDESDLFNVNRGKLDCNWWWILQQKQLSGIAFFDFELLYKTYLSKNINGYEYCDYVTFCEEKTAKDKKKAIIGGYIHSFEVKGTSKGDVARIILDNNYDFMDVTIWSEQFDDLKETLGIDPVGKLMLISGNVVSYRGKAGLNTNTDTQMVILE